MQILTDIDSLSFYDTPRYDQYILSLEKVSYCRIR